MVLSFEPPDPQFVAFIDEAGDPGLSRVRPVDPAGSTEWLSVAALVVRLSREPSLVGWVQDIRSAIRARQGPALHYRTLTPDRKTIVCKKIATLPVRCFVLMSNKKNMKGHTNERAEAARGASTQEWFYNYCIRLLLERVTDFVEGISLAEFGAPKHLKIVFSRRGGLRYSQTIAYLDLLRNQARSDTTFLKKRVIKWPVLHPKLINSIPHEKSAGAQLADAVASAFFQATNTSGQGSWDCHQAQLLKPRIWEKDGVYENAGVSLHPTPYSKAQLSEQQKQVFRFYGFRI